MVNQWVNWHVRYRVDQGSDEWSTSAATLMRGYGDCEDFAVAKMGLLLALGVPADDMYLVLLRDRRQVQHAVLAVKREGQLLVLDNRTDKVLPAEAIDDYTPIMSFSGPFAWTYGRLALR
jgi:predicted transglutaminase-like cysteine proteinase